MRTVRVPLGDRSYSIFIGPDLLSQLGRRCRSLGLGRRCAIIVDEQVAPHYAQPVEEALRQAGFEPITLTTPAGESAKSLKTVQLCYDQLAAHRLERASFVVAVGGGVIGDLAGFVAATYLRGIPYVQVPTTLLAQVDSSVGGKVGVNLRSGKNLVGAFHQPRLVLADLTTLETLPEREFRAGLAEVIKYGIIRDAALFRKLERDLPGVLRRDPRSLAQVVAQSCRIKANVVREDEHEGGLRAILNFGHTIGHALEAISGYREYLHGEAIAIGQVLAAKLSRELLGLPEKDVERIRSLFERADLPTAIQWTPARKQRLFEAMQRDKKVRGGEVRFVLVRRIGQAEFDQRVPADLIDDLLTRESATGRRKRFGTSNA